MTLLIPSRFNGPDNSGNGGYVAGLLAATLDPGPVTVSLRRPPPLDTPMDVATADGRSVAQDADGAIVEARLAARGEELPRVLAVDLPAARAAAERFPGHVAHPFPRCFVCGSARDRGDGLRLFSGPLGDGRSACVWHVEPDIAGQPEFVWAALDCPGAWTAHDKMPMVLGSITGLVSTLPEPDEDCVVLGEFLGTERRKVWTATTAYGSDGRELGRAHATWITI
ncbi:hypothetical protein [Rhodococcus maanshanensis]|uniref:Uncharacterized protein n=1 Tax=Rhodococcus maanshanensis TaxID=183556 RepID=A0A1H7T9D0_9NOCA|nr:hypothetical protein [Rhodococcus maanshanensis]SEL81343.1 hypothetical protein SAMN05444583_11547 [Rhodococcus maanshanensis]